MTQNSKRNLDQKILKKIERLFCQALAEIKTTPEAEQFCHSFFTPAERIMFTKRFSTLYLLEKNISPGEIAHLLKTSSSTVSRTNILKENLEKEEKQLIKKLIFKKELANFFKEMLVGFIRDYDGNVVPKGRNPKNWWQEKYQWEKEKANPLR